MTIADKLLESGLHCPCGGACRVNDNIVYCTVCGGQTDQYGSIIAALTAWLILTGGPVPGEVLPPVNVAIWMDFPGDVISEAGQYCGDVYIPNWDGGTGAIFPEPLRWWFLERTESIIRPWLESEWREDAG